MRGTAEKRTSAAAMVRSGRSEAESICEELAAILPERLKLEKREKELKDRLKGLMKDGEVLAGIKCEVGSKIELTEAGVRYLKDTKRWDLVSEEKVSITSLRALMTLDPALDVKGEFVKEILGSKSFSLK